MKIILKGSKLGIHSIKPNQATSFVQNAVDRGFYFPVVKGVDNAGLALDVKKYSPNSITITRFVNDKWDSAQNVHLWDINLMQLAARETIDLVFNRTNAEERIAADYFEVLNEADPEGVEGWRKFGLFLIEVIKEANNRGLKLAIPGFNNGTPEYDEAQAMIGTGLFKLMKDTGHILTLHEGVFNNDMIQMGYGDIIPGAPYVEGAGSLAFRYRYFYNLLKQRNEVVPLVISEMYPGSSYLSDVDLVGRIRWYDTEVRKDYYVWAFLPFTIDVQNSWDWAGQVYNWVYPDFIDYMDSIKNQDNAVEFIPPPADPFLGKIVETITGLNCRSGPGTVFPVLTTFYTGTRFKVQEVSGNWARVTTNGWVNKSYLRIV